LYTFEQQPSIRELHSFSSHYVVATGATPAMEKVMAGQGSQYAAAYVDAQGSPLDGGQTHRQHLRTDIPVNTFWSVIACNNHARSIFQADQRFLIVSNQCGYVMINEQGSVDVRFDPEAPLGLEPNWIPTVPGKGWKMLLRLCCPLRAWFDRTWRQCEIEFVETRLFRPDQKAQMAVAEAAALQSCHGGRCHLQLTQFQRDRRLTERTKDEEHRPRQANARRTLPDRNPGAGYAPARTRIRANIRAQPFHTGKAQAQGFALTGPKLG
jgi:hypothetical protein